MAQILPSNASCAVHEIKDLPDAGNDRLTHKSAISEIVDAANIVDTDDDGGIVVGQDEIPAFYLFFQALTPRTKSKGWCEKFALYIEKAGLGSVSQSEPRINPNSGFRVIVFTWAVNRNEFIKWIKKHFRDN